MARKKTAAPSRARKAKKTATKKKAVKKKATTKKKAVAKKKATKKKASSKKKAASKKKAVKKKAVVRKKAAKKKATTKKKAVAKKKASTKKKVGQKKKGATKKKAGTKKKASQRKTVRKTVAKKKASSKRKAAGGRKRAAVNTPEPPILPAPEVGDAAPDFTLEADDGTEVSLEDFRGQTVVLYFYPKDNTPGCTTEACNFRDVYGEIEARGATVVGVSRDSVKSHAGFKAKQNLNFPLLSDPTGEMIAQYGAWGPKAFMGRKFNGILRSTVIIDPDGRIAKIYPKVSVKTHADEVLADLDALE